MSDAVEAIVSPIAGLLGALSPKAPKMPKAEVPAAPAPTRRTDTGASVVIGSDAVKNQRVSGSAVKKTTTRATDPLGGLGSSAGLNL